MFFEILSKTGFGEQRGLKLGRPLQDLHNKNTKIAHQRRGNKVTIQDLSYLLNLSKSTVSRALNKYPDIAESTQIRAASAAKKLGYRPSTHA